MTTPPKTTIRQLAKPTMGQPCNGCGLCCRVEVCGMGLEAMGEDTPTPCPALVESDGRTWCDVIRVAEKMDIAFAADLKWRLGIGVGCQVDDDYALLQEAFNSVTGNQASSETSGSLRSEALKANSNSEKGIA